MNRFLTSVALIAALLPGAARAQANAPAAAASLALELNAAETTEKGCRLTFVVTNKLGGDIERAAFELALFDASGVVSRLTVLEFKDMVDGKTKVSRFELPGAPCDGISRVLVNHASDCAGKVEPTACMRGLATSSRTKIDFGV